LTSGKDCFAWATTAGRNDVTTSSAGSKPARSTAITSGTYPSSLSSTSSLIRPVHTGSTSVSSGGRTPAAAAMSSRVSSLTGAPPASALWKAISSPSRVLRTSHSIMSAPTSIALVKAAMVFSAAPDATPRWAAIIARIMPKVCPAQARFSEEERESARPFRIIATVALRRSAARAPRHGDDVDGRPCGECTECPNVNPFGSTGRTQGTHDPGC
jgi:hypothetical protein